MLSRKLASHCEPVGLRGKGSGAGAGGIGDAAARDITGERIICMGEEAAIRCCISPIRTCLCSSATCAVRSAMVWSRSERGVDCGGNVGGGG